MSALSSRQRVQVEERRLQARVDRRCRHCGYGIVTARPPAQCPMCGGSSWQPSSGSAAHNPPKPTRVGIKLDLQRLLVPLEHLALSRRIEAQ